MPRATTKSTVTKARTLRQNLSLPEALLWPMLKGQPQGIKFRRQHPVGPYILDFYAPASKLAIEIDGAAHDMCERPERDVQRDAWLREQGFDILRIPASEILKNPAQAAEAILTYVAHSNSPSVSATR